MGRSRMGRSRSGEMEGKERELIIGDPELERTGERIKLRRRCI